MKKKIIIFGANGLLGYALLNYFYFKKNYDVYGVVRNNNAYKKLKKKFNNKIIQIKNYKKIDVIDKLFKKIKPQIIINCVGIIKQSRNINNTNEVIYINSILPHLFDKFAVSFKARLIHFSTDCVFVGKKGNYSEDDFPSSEDIYGRSKFLGEVKSKNSITLRTSIIGHEIDSSKSLLNWFMSKSKNVKGYINAIFSGLPVSEIAKIIDKYIIPNKRLNGILHISSNPISKYHLLLIIKKIYDKKINILINRSKKIDRSLNSSLFRKLTGYKIKPWSQMIREMKFIYENEY